MSRRRNKRTGSFDFEKLESLRLFSRQILQKQVASLEYFRYDGGFSHVKGQSKRSVSSSATCILSLAATDSWRLSAGKVQTKRLSKYLLSRTESAGLKPNNPFTTAWILEAVSALEDCSEPLDKKDKKLLGQKEAILQDEIRKSEEGGIGMKPYPPSGYLTQLVVRALDHRSKLGPDLKERVNKWAWAELARQLALVHAKSKTQDAFSLAYLVMLATAVTPSSMITPQQVSTQRSALKTFFACQLDDGTWPLSRPLFHYPEFGNAHCYEYEMLTQLLHEPGLRDLLFPFLPNLKAAAEAVSDSAYRVGNTIYIWNSGHHPNQAEPESWATASVYHFFHELDRLLAEAVRRELFRYLDMPFFGEGDATKKRTFAPDFLDSSIKVNGESHSLKKSLELEFVSPLAEEAKNVENGGRFKKGTPISAIFFGPPGTSKTELAKKIADFLGWPLLAIDPSHLLRNGMEGIQAEANTIFRMLAETERVVVLFDEFDEFVRERGLSDAQQFSRLMTTAMLPKLADIRKRRTLVFIIATNNIHEFDLAIQRPGRFDRIVQIMPPTCEAKLSKKDWGAEGNIDLKQKFEALGQDLDTNIVGKLGDLTYLECDALATQLGKTKKLADAIKTLDDHWKRCILNALTGEPKITWKERCEKEEHFNRFS